MAIVLSINARNFILPRKIIGLYSYGWMDNNTSTANSTTALIIALCMHMPSQWASGGQIIYLYKHLNNVYYDKM